MPTLNKMTDLRRHFPDIPAAGPRAATSRAQEFWNQNPRVAQALRATTSASVAWTLVFFIPGPWTDYPYYAPLGAVVATSTNLASSTKQSLQAVGAIALGALIARLVDLVPVPQLLSIAIVILIAVAASGWRRLGPMNDWVTTSALFILILGDSDPIGYIGAFIGLTFFGALIGIVVNMIFPSLLLSPTRKVLEELRDTLADQLDALADVIDQTDPEGPDDVAETRVEIPPIRLRADTALADSTQATSANWRAVRYKSHHKGLQAQSATLNKAASTIDGMTELIGGAQTGGEGEAISTELAPKAAAALQRSAAALRTLEGGAMEVHSQQEAQEAVDRFDAALTERESPSGNARVADGVLIALSQLLQVPAREAQDAEA